MIKGEASDGFERPADGEASAADPAADPARGSSIPDGGDAEAAWQRFLKPADGAEFLSGWLEIAISRIRNARSGLLFLRGEGEQFGLAASHNADPGERDAIQAFAEKLSERPRPMVNVLPGGRALAGYPIEPGGELQALLIVVLTGHDGRKLHGLMRDMHWATGWIEAQLWRGKSSLRIRQVRSARMALDFLAAADEHRRFDGAVLALVNALPEFTGFERGAIGMLRGGRVRLEAFSRAAVFKRKSELVADLEAAMDEAVAQDDVIVFPRRKEMRVKIDLAHRAFASRSGSGAILTAPLIVRGRAVGALLLEKGRREDEVVGVDPDAIEEIRLAAASVAPLLKAKFDERRWISGRGRDLAGRGLSAVLGRRPAIALGALAALAVVVLPLVITVPLRISGKASLEGREQRAAVSLVDGFLREAPKRAGDRVAVGDVLARLDDRDLQLELSRDEAAIAQAEQAVRSAMSGGERAKAAEASAQLAEARANYQLTRSRLADLDVVSPMEGIIVSGDLSQRLGAPVSRGDVLFEIARLDGYRVRIDVSEYDLAPVSPGQSGSVVLNSLPDQPLAIEVSTISSVSDPAGSENRFRLEARVVDLPEAARPGMEGIAKIDTGEASLAWVALRGTVRRMQIFFWRWTP